MAVEDSVSAMIFTQYIDRLQKERISLFVGHRWAFNA
jgi:hypothetical protein